MSEKVPVAVNCWEVPMAMLELAGVTAMDTSVTTVRVVVPVRVPNVAVIVVEPTEKEVANPVLLIVAMFEFDEVQTTEAVRSLEEPSE